MVRYFLSRLLIAIPTLLAVITLSFFLVRAAPGNPFDSEKPLPPTIRANLDAKYGLDKPVFEQFTNYVGGLVKFSKEEGSWLPTVTLDFGPSYQYKDRTVTYFIQAGFPVSLKLGLMAIAIALVIGVGAGSLAALRQNTWMDYTVMGFSMTGITVPNFVVGPILQLIVISILSATAVQLVPITGWGDSWKQAIMPVFVLALPQIAYIARQTRGSMIEVLRSNYIRTARAKGVPERTMIIRHALKAALLPIVSYLGPAVAAITTGSVVVEKIFRIPGIGTHFVNGALNRDYTMVMGVVIFFGALIIIANLIVDVLYGLLDPRVRAA
jgi:oligopeptide transport system permease protein